MCSFGWGSAHAYTRGTVTTPEASHPDRDVGSTDYVAAGVMMAPTYLKWMLIFEDPNTRTVMLGKATPRDWLAPGSTPIAVRNATTRYGRVAYDLRCATEVAISGQRGSDTSALTVRASVMLPHTYVGATGPPGGVKLRLRVPVEYAGKLRAVSVGGKPWSAFDAKSETVDFAQATLTPAVLRGMQTIVAEFAGAV